MADIITEINTIGDLLADVGVTRFYKQNLPTVYVANTIGIRYQGEQSESMTNVVYGVERPYQVIYFGTDEIDCIEKAEKMHCTFNNAMKVKLRGLNGYITLGSFAFSAPYKTETDGVYAVVGILPITSYMQRSRPTPPKMQNIEARYYENLDQSSWDDMEANPVQFVDLTASKWDGIKATLIDVAQEDE